MTPDVLLFWIRAVCVICSIATVSVPILYSLTPWRTRLFGRLFMLQSVSLAVAMNGFTLFAFWRPENMVLLFTVRMVLLSGLAISTSLMAIMMVRIPMQSRKKVEPNDSE
jgi:hypothetical protein